MSMSQEEIESLMNGLEIDNSSDDNSASELVEDNKLTISEDDINELKVQTEDVISSDKEEKEKIDSKNESDEGKTEDEETQKSEETIDVAKEDLKAEVTKQIVEQEHSNHEDISNDNLGDLVASIDNIEVDSNSNNTEEIKESSSTSSNNQVDEDIDTQINSGVFPLPVAKDTKVVSQLHEVANDSEEKATKIFDVLSNVLDYNNDIQNDINVLSDFKDKQLSMLSSLSEKFPNIESFKVNLQEAKEINKYMNSVNEKLNNGNMEIFQAMELMQYHDINRQKIERVMSVIKKLTIYLNNLFEDDGHNEIAVAKHIPGDNSADLVDDDDLDALIEEFNK